MVSKRWNVDGYVKLGNAVVIQAARDYRSALKRLWRRPENGEANKMKNDCERFFKNEIELYTDLDGLTLMRMIREKVGEECKPNG